MTYTKMVFNDNVINNLNNRRFMTSVFIVLRRNIDFDPWEMFSQKYVKKYSFIYILNLAKPKIFEDFSFTKNLIIQIYQFFQIDYKNSLLGLRS